MIERRDLPALVRNGVLIGRSRIGHHQQDSAGIHRFFGRGGTIVVLQDLAGGCIQLRERSVDVQRCVDPIADSNQLARHLRRTAFSRPMPGKPVLDWSLPEDDAVERVASDQLPVGRQQTGDARPFIDDVEHSPSNPAASTIWRALSSKACSLPNAYGASIILHSAAMIVPQILAIAYLVPPRV